MRRIHVSARIDNAGKLLGSELEEMDLVTS